MLDYQKMNHYIQEMTLTYLDICCKKHHIIVNPYDLKIILKIIQNNSYSLMNAEYHPILFNEISRETNLNTLDKIKPMIVENYLLKLLM